VLLTVSAMRTPDGTLTGYMATASDITGQVAARAELAESEQRFRLAFDTAPVGMMIVGLVGAAASRILRVNSTLCEFSGRNEAALLELDMHALTHVDDQVECRVSFAPFLRGELSEARVEKRYQHVDGSTRWGLLSATTVRPGHGQDPYLLCLIEDVSDRKAAQDALTHRALHDPLTGLPNRALFTDRLEHALTDAARTGLRSGLVYLDLDGFKHVNDTAGHAAGDELLQQVAARLRQCLRPGDTLARLGGDEFAVLCPGSSGAVALVAERLLQALRAPVVLPAGTYSVSASLGVTLTLAQDSAEAAVQRADAAMYAAKRGGKDQVRVDPTTHGLDTAVPAQRTGPVRTP
jgi:diguanylate cyclase (GGDEF)-like protein/PAS domain S-box-containing protein